MTVGGSEIGALVPGWGFARVVTAGSGSGATVLALSGDLTRANAAALRTALIDALGDGSPRLVLDLSEVRSVDGSGVQAFDLAAARAMRRGGALRLAAVPAHLAGHLGTSYRLGAPAVYAGVCEALAAPWHQFAWRAGA